MSNTLQTLVAVIALIFALSVIVQAVQEFIKNLLDAKTATMTATINQFMGSFLALPDVKKALTVRGLDLTALEHFNAADFRQLLDGIPFEKEKLQGIVASADAKVEDIKDNIAASYEAARAAFQKAYTKKNKVIALVLSMVVVALLNANIVFLYENISADAAAQQAVLGKVPVAGNSTDGQGGAADPIAAYKRSRETIVKVLNSEPVLVRTARYGEDLSAHPVAEILGLLIMGALVSLGAPFWNDVLKGATGMNNALNGGGKRA